jgi:hypothetical protein
MKRRLLEEQAGTGGKGKARRGGKTKKAVTEVVWIADGAAPLATREPVLRIVELALVAISHDLQHKLADFILAIKAPTPGPPTAILSAPLSFVAAMKQCSHLENVALHHDFNVMMSYITAAFYIQS